MIKYMCAVISICANFCFVQQYLGGIYMESYSRLYTKKIVDSIIHSLEQKHSSVLFVKHYNTLNVPIDNIQESVAGSKKKIELLYHEFSATKMQEAYEPFLGWIKQLYFRFYCDVSVSDFLEAAGVYYLARSAIESYILTGKCKRIEDMIPVETEYELKMFADSLAKLFDYVSEHHTLFFVLNRLHLAENSTLHFLTEFISKPKKNISLLANYNEAYVVPAYTKDRWISLVHKIEDMNYMLEWNVQDVQTEMNINDVFEPVMTDFPEYLIMINNMIQTVAIKQAMYYLKILYNKISTEKVNISSKNKAKFYILYALASLYNKNITNALIMCEKLKNINEKHPDPKYSFNYHYLLALCESFEGQRSLAEKNCAKCTQIAIEIESDKYLFMSQLLYYIYSLDSWNNTYRWDRKFEGEELDAFAEKAMKYHAYNHLAHIFFFGCGNEKENYTNESCTCEDTKYFKKAMQIAQMLNNERLIISAWKKSVFMAQGYGCFGYVDYYYKRCLEIIERQNNPVEEANIYNGLGFNRIVSEQFTIANEYFNKALDIFYAQKKYYFVAETLYNMATNAILADNYETACNNLMYCLKLLKAIKKNRMNICNMSKVYGMIAYCSYKMGIDYNAHFYLNKMERVLYHVIHPDGEPSYFLWDDDMFFYYFDCGLLEKSENIEKAQLYFDKARYHMLRSDGLQFFVYTMFALEQADLYEKQNEPEKAKEILETCMEFCNSRGYKHKEEILFARLHKQALISKYVPLPLTGVDKYQIEELAQRAEMEMMLADRTKGMDFLVAWQELINKENYTIDDIIENSMTTMQNNYNLDGIIYVEIVDKKPVLRYMCGDYEISDDQLTNITEYLTRHKKEFVTSRYDREFYNMQSIVSVLGVNKIVSFGCVPISVDEELTGYIIAAIDLHDNMTNNIVFLDRNDITIFKFALSQLTDNLYRLKARDEISQMNKKLQRSAVTDLLTGLMNRQGFAKKVGDYEELVRSGKKENICATVLYIDLDNFKLCNDTFGHAVGDVILKCFSCLIERVADSESYVVRYGGDEFLLIMPGHELDDGIVVAKEIYNQLKIENNFIDDIEEAVHGTVDISPDRRVSCSIGIASVDKYDRESVDLALKHADSKLYAVKKSEKSNYSVWRDEIDGE